MIARNHHHLRVGKRLHQSRELTESMQDRRIRRTDGMEDIPRDENEVGLQVDHGVNHPLE
jgi:hypothetical protein